MNREFFSLLECWFNLFNAALSVLLLCCVSDQSVSVLLLIVAWLKLVCDWWRKTYTQYTSCSPCKGDYLVIKSKTCFHLLLFLFKAWISERYSRCTLSGCCTALIVEFCLFIQRKIINYELWDIRSTPINHSFKYFFIKTRASHF